MNRSATDLPDGERTSLPAPKAPRGLVEIDGGARLSPLQWVERRMLSRPLIGPLAVLVIALIVFSIVSPNFGTLQNFSLILQQVQVIALLGIAQTLIILTAGIDLSVAAVMLLAQVVMGKLAVTLGLPVEFALLLGVLVGVICGAINGLIVTKLNIPPFIATLGTLSIFYALNIFISDGESVPYAEVPALLTWLGTGFQVFGTTFTYGQVLTILMFVLFAYILRSTAWGTHIYAVGDNLEAARLSGIRVNRVLMSVYIVAGLIIGVTAWLLIGRIGSISPTAGASYNLASITAVVIGGTSLFGGRGRIMGTLLGAVIVGVFSSGLSLAGFDNLWQEFTIGILIIGAVAVDQRLRKIGR
ncbi:ABC transporter permease [Herbiconiux sp. CPCC 203407]|uniref:ABC transporter permease n=1 Tax=Herbiconiux oxytropis TaxID=2970915 RepID=A0AA41XKE3_9MICO|nr:ABC transporter permease [Herbiconiux oxytropis]MCS5723671.1 ABC transporter permease [Herbiconiux oxytropis]MCS5728080.1 ABC transporter permease [Herbiconiux oxytropis]